MHRYKTNPPADPSDCLVRRSECGIGVSFALLSFMYMFQGSLIHLLLNLTFYELNLLSCKFYSIQVAMHHEFDGAVR